MIVRRPSTSQYEHLPDIYYEAELIGTMHACDVFRHSCPISILNVISIFNWINNKAKHTKYQAIC